MAHQYDEGPNPGPVTIDGLTAYQRAQKSIAEAWSYYANGGGGDPRYFDYQTWIRMKEREWAREDEAARER